MKKGKTYSDVAVYLPTEDAWRTGKMPKEKQCIWSWGTCEMRYRDFPKETRGHLPLWINGKYLEKGSLNEHGKLEVGNAIFNSLYVNAEDLSPKNLERIADLVSKGFPITLKKRAKTAGTRSHPP